MDRILEKCTGVCGIADGFVVYGATEVEHDRNLLQFMDVAKQHGLTLNSAKCDIKCNKVSFFGQLYTSEGIKPDPQKVKDFNFNLIQRALVLEDYAPALGVAGFVSRKKGARSKGKEEKEGKK